MYIYCVKSFYYFDSILAILTYFCRYIFHSYDSVFTGIDMVEWLLNERIVNNVEEAVDYGQTLLEGRIVSHVSGEHNFHNDNYYYKFIE